MTRRTSIWRAAAAALASACALAGCATPAENIALGAVGVTALGAQSPSNEIEVTYYLGVFDPQDQLPPTVYRVRVHGQASFISQATFAAGWVRAELIDSLSTGGRFDDDGKGITIDKGNTLEGAKLQTGRRLVMFGPEGFREAPRDHRLVVVMGSNPSAYFEAVDKALGSISEAQAAKKNSDLAAKLFAILAQLRDESDRLGDLDKNVAATFPNTK